MFGEHEKEVGVARSGRRCWLQCNGDYDATEHECVGVVTRETQS